MSTRPLSKGYVIPRTAYDLERRITNWIPVGPDLTGIPPTFNDLAIGTSTYTSAVGGNAPPMVALNTSYQFTRTSIRMRSVTILADPGNIGRVLVGPSQPLFPLLPGAAYTYNGMDLKDIFYAPTQIGPPIDVIYGIVELV